MREPLSLSRLADLLLDRIALPPIFRVAVLCGLLLFVVSCGPLPDYEASQEQSAIPAPRITRDKHLTQTFRATRPDLSDVELLIVVFPDDSSTIEQLDQVETNVGEDGDLIVRLLGADGRADGSVQVEIASSRWPVAGLTHNSRLRLRFPPQPDSEGKAYTLAIETSAVEESRATVWASAGDVYPDGEATSAGAALPADLTYRAYYDYQPLTLASELLSALVRRGWALALALPGLFLPGLALTRLLIVHLKKTDEADGGTTLDLAEWLGLSLGLSLAVSPLLLLWLTALGLRLTPWLTVAFFALCLGYLALSLWRDSSIRPIWKSLERLLTFESGLALFVAIGAFALRYVHSRDLALPMWGDAIHHTLIADLIARLGQVPVDYGPLAPSETFSYHFGYHLQVVFLRWLSELFAGQAAVSSAEGVLIIGQMLSAMLVFPTYLLASRLGRSRLAGASGGLIVGLISVLPAYSVTWSRFPQLAGIAVIPAAALLFGLFLSGPFRPTRLLFVLVALAGLALNHPRVTLFFSGYIAATLLLAHTPLRRHFLDSSDESPRDIQAWGRAILLAGLSALAILPWLASLARSGGAEDVVRPGPLTSFNFPIALLTIGFDRYLLAAAIVGLAFSLYLRRKSGVTIFLWALVALAIANARRLGLPIYPMLTNEALAISLFLPIAVLVGMLIAWLVELLEAGIGIGFQRYSRWGLATIFFVGGALGGANLASVVNPVCVLAVRGDVEALEWTRANTPTDARFLINAYRWQGEVYMGSDAGYWLPPLADRYASTPPLVYDLAAAADRKEIQSVGDALSGERLSAESIPSLMREHDLGYVFIGSRGGTLTPDLLESVPELDLIFSNGRARIYRLRDPAS